MYSTIPYFTVQCSYRNTKSRHVIVATGLKTGSVLCNLCRILNGSSVQCCAIVRTVLGVMNVLQFCVVYCSGVQYGTVQCIGWQNSAKQGTANFPATCTAVEWCILCMVSVVTSAVQCSTADCCATYCAVGCNTAKNLEKLCRSVEYFTAVWLVGCCAIECSTT